MLHNRCNVVLACICSHEGYWLPTPDSEFDCNDQSLCNAFSVASEVCGKNSFRSDNQSGYILLLKMVTCWAKMPMHVPATAFHCNEMHLIRPHPPHYYIPADNLQCV